MKKLVIVLSFLFLVFSLTVFADPIPIPHPAGSDSQIQYNNGGLFGGDSTFTFNDSTKVISATAIDTDYAWVDTLGTITTDWFGGVSTQNDGGLNDCSSFIFDRQSARHIYCRIYGLSAYLKIYCIAYGY